MKILSVYSLLFILSIIFGIIKSSKQIKVMIGSIIVVIPVAIFIMSIVFKLFIG